MLAPDGTSVLTGLDVAELADDGTPRRVVGFFGARPAGSHQPATAKHRSGLPERARRRLPAVAHRATGIDEPQRYWSRSLSRRSTNHGTYRSGPPRSDSAACWACERSSAKLSAHITRSSASSSSSLQRPVVHGMAHSPGCVSSGQRAPAITSTASSASSAVASISTLIVQTVLSLTSLMMPRRVGARHLPPTLGQPAPAHSAGIDGR